MLRGLVLGLLSAASHASNFVVLTANSELGCGTCEETWAKIAAVDPPPDFVVIGEQEGCNGAEAKRLWKCLENEGNEAEAKYVAPNPFMGIIGRTKKTQIFRTYQGMHMLVLEEKQASLTAFKADKITESVFLEKGAINFQFMFDGQQYSFIEVHMPTGGKKGDAPDGMSAAQWKNSKRDAEVQKFFEQGWFGDAATHVVIFGDVNTRLDNTPENAERTKKQWLTLLMDPTENDNLMKDDLLLQSDIILEYHMNCGSPLTGAGAPAPIGLPIPVTYKRYYKTEEQRNACRLFNEMYARVKAGTPCRPDDLEAYQDAAANCLFGTSYAELDEGPMNQKHGAMSVGWLDRICLKVGAAAHFTRKDDMVESRNVGDHLVTMTVFSMRDAEGPPPLLRGKGFRKPKKVLSPGPRGKGPRALPGAARSVPAEDPPLMIRGKGILSPKSSVPPLTVKGIMQGKNPGREGKEVLSLEERHQRALAKKASLS